MMRRLAAVARILVLVALLVWAGTSLAVAHVGTRAASRSTAAGSAFRVIDAQILQHPLACDPRLDPTSSIDLSFTARFVVYYRLPKAGTRRPTGVLDVTGLPQGSFTAPLRRRTVAPRLGYLYADLRLSNTSPMHHNLTATFTVSLAGRSVTTALPFTSTIITGCFSVPGPVTVDPPRLLHRTGGAWKPTKALIPREPVRLFVSVSAAAEKYAYTVTTQVFTRTDGRNRLVHTYTGGVPALESKTFQYQVGLPKPNAAVLAGQVTSQAVSSQVRLGATRNWLFTMKSSGAPSAASLLPSYQLLHYVGRALQPTTMLRAGETGVFAFFPGSALPESDISDAYVSITQNNATIVPESSLLPDAVNARAALDTVLRFSSSHSGQAFADMVIVTSSPSLMVPLRFSIS